MDFKPPSQNVRPSRRVSKQIMERKRRARINHCLQQLKQIVLKDFSKDPQQYDKLEKADILEHTVNYLMKNKPNSSQSSQSTDCQPTSLHENSPSPPKSSSPELSSQSTPPFPSISHDTSATRSSSIPISQSARKEEHFAGNVSFYQTKKLQNPNLSDSSHPRYIPPRGDRMVATSSPRCQSPDSQSPNIVTSSKFREISLWRPWS